MKSLFIRALLVLGISWFGSNALAEMEVKGWNAAVGLIVGGVSGEGQLDAYGGKKRIESLDEKPARYNYDFLFPEVQLGYTFENNITIYADGGLLDGGGIGVRYLFADETRLTLSLPLFLGTSGEVWQDPYLTGRDRKKTDARLDAAVGLSIDNLWGTFASISYDYQDLSIKNDQAGESLNARLNASEIKQLQRDSQTHRVLASLPPLTLSDGLYLIGGASYTRTHAEGDANSFIARSADLTLAYEKGRFEIFAQISGAVAKYRTLNPVFDTRRKDDLSTISAGITYWQPFDWKHSSLDLLLVSERNNSNINFYDTSTELLTASFNYYF
ncbi:MAG TPA: DUF2860 domain-containing protein [Gammaproteobacteria bacterium]|nr:DUF2860 domain-containing protein [Gammaproteobacteria bacterium]